MIFKSINHCLQQLKILLEQINATDYAKPSQPLSNSTIGQHTRHIIEMFLCLTNEYQSGRVNYDQRERNYQIDTDPKFASIQINKILSIIKQPDKDLILEQEGFGETIIIKTNYYRELVYNLEHCIHHQAMIKIATLLNMNNQIDPDFGVAFSTIAYRKSIQ